MKKKPKKRKYIPEALPTVREYPVNPSDYMATSGNGLYAERMYNTQGYSDWLAARNRAISNGPRD